MKDYSELDGFGDNSRKVIKAEVELYLSEYKDIIYDGGHYIVKGTTIRIGGDNLLTTRMMKRKMEIQNEQGENDKCFKGYFLLPYIPQSRESKRYSVNSLRSTVTGYNDNPFVFFLSLKKMYDNDFKLEGNADKLEEAICKTRAYWKLFGKEENGYKNLLEAFCLPDMEEYKSSDRFGVFFTKEVKPSREKWEDYKALLDDFKNARIKLVNKRICDIPNAE